MPQPDIINDRYQINDRIGEGGMAYVYRAEDKTLGRTVALKMIRTDEIPPSQLERILQRFQREARNLSVLSDVPGVVTLLDYGIHKNMPYLVMTHMPGGTLKDKLGAPIPIEEAVAMLQPIIEALIYVHEMDIIHRDIKPSNLLIDRFGRLALADFGVAKAFDMGDHTLTGTGLGVGTAAYMAPEQWRGQSNKQSDIYSLGVVLYEMLTGRKPFEGETASDVFLKVMTEPLPDPRTFAPSINDRTVTFLEHAMARDLSHRLQDIPAMQRQLQVLLTPIKQTPSVPAPEPILAQITLNKQPIDPEATYDELQEQQVSLQKPALPEPAPTPTIKAEAQSSIKKSGTIGQPQNEMTIMLPGGVSMVFVRVPAGKFWMGADNNDPHANEDEKPMHEVYLDEYWIGKYPVTNRQFQLYLGGTKQERLVDQFSPDKPDHPVVFISWDDAKGFCQWLAKITGKSVSLPTEAQWEKAARGTDRRIYPWGNDSPVSSTACYGRLNKTTATVGSYPDGTSPYGAMDMAGNVWEWVADWYDHHYYRISPNKNPTGPNKGEHRVLRGGSWYDAIYNLRSSVRDNNLPADDRGIDGFRCAIYDSSSL
jgi:eukaryotic-like serine/threonine-protein kinase